MNNSYLEDFLKYYKSVKESFVKEQDFVNDLFLRNDNPNIKENIKYLCENNKNGKYIRGTLIMLGNYLYGNKADAKMLAFAYELFETSILIHDDIIDNGLLRRNLKTIPLRVEDVYKDNSLEFGKNIALCDGIYGYYLANNMIIDNYGDSKYLKDILHLYNSIVLKTVEGEILDVTLPFKCQKGLYYPSEEDIMEIYIDKTAWYTIIGPFLLGMMLNGMKASKKLIDILKNIGVAFQIKDDILGLYADNLDKTLNDVMEYKQTILYSYAINTDKKDEVLKYYGTDNGKKIKELFKECGAYDYAINKLDFIYKETSKNIDGISDLTMEGKNILKGLLEFIITREK